MLLADSGSDKLDKTTVDRQMSNVCNNHKFNITRYQSKKLIPTVWVCARGIRVASGGKMKIIMNFNNVAIYVAVTIFMATSSAKSAQARPIEKLDTNTIQAAYYALTKPTIRKVSYQQPSVQRTSSERLIWNLDLSNSFAYALSNAAIERTTQGVRYDGKYIEIEYPWGDVPASIGVCTDVVIRSYRRLGIDLQSEVYNDISKDFYAYPSFTEWGLTQPDPNIDHRRVYNLQVFLTRHDAELPRSLDPRDYKPGDLVTWMVGPNFPHIGVVVDIPSPSNPNRFMISHNIGEGPKIEDILFRFPMTGHYRYTPENRKVNPALMYAKTPAPVIRKGKEMTDEELVIASQYLAGL